MTTSLFSENKSLRKLYIPGLLALAGIIIGLAWAEQITLTTYYPAPYGVYKEMNVHYLDFKNDEYQEADPANMPEHEEARICYDNDVHQFKYSDGSTWLPLGRGGGVINVVQAVGTSNVSTHVMMGFVDMPDMSVNIDTQGGNLLILFSATINNSGSYVTPEFRILINGNPRDVIDDSITDEDYDRIHVSAHWLETGLAAGNHTIQVQWVTYDNELVQEGSPYPRILTVFEL